MPQIAAGYIRGHQVAGEFMESLLAAQLHDQHVWNMLKGRIIPTPCPHYFNLGRNQLTAAFCDQYGNECDVFVSLDTDHAFLPAQLWEIAALVDPVERPIVSALYHACDDNGRQVRPIILRRQPDESLKTVWDFPPNQLVECDVVGMGFCAISAPWLLRMRASIGDHWYDFEENARGDFMAEDDAFCFRMQQYLGAKIFVHTGIQIGHMKTVELRGAKRAITNKNFSAREMEEVAQ